MNQDYKTLCICSNPLGYLLGMHAIPSALYSAKMSLSEKNLFFSTWIREDGILSTYYLPNVVDETYEELKNLSNILLE